MAMHLDHYKWIIPSIEKKLQQSNEKINFFIPISIHSAHAALKQNNCLWKFVLKKCNQYSRLWKFLNFVTLTILLRSKLSSVRSDAHDSRIKQTNIKWIFWVKYFERIQKKLCIFFKIGNCMKKIQVLSKQSEETQHSFIELSKSRTNEFRSDCKHWQPLNFILFWNYRKNNAHNHKTFNVKFEHSCDLNVLSLDWAWKFRYF